MFRFIWNSWWRNKERFLLLIIGALIVSIGLSYLVGITQASNATIVDELQQRWKSSYHIVVRPPDSRSVTEEQNLLEPNYLSGLSGGITLNQYKEIKKMTDIDVAAPIAMMGYMQNSTQLNQVNYSEPGIYRMTIKETTNTGVKQEVDESNIYFTVNWDVPKDTSEYGVTRFLGDLSYGTNVLIAGIDPKAEAELVGINHAIVNDSEYLNEKDSVKAEEVIDGIKTNKIPVIISNQEYVDGKINYTIEKLELQFGDDPTSVMEKIKEKGGKSYLEKVAGTEVDQFNYTTKEAHQKVVKQISDNINSKDSSWMPYKPSSVNYREVTSPYVERWPFAYEVEPYIVPEDSLLAVNYAYRPISMFGDESSSWPRIQLDFKGVFDPSKLNVSKDPLTELPMETYFPSKAQWVLDDNGKPINPPKKMKPLNNPYGFLTKPPLMLTTLQSAAEILGNEPISAIRLKIKGVKELNKESEQKLQAVAKRIEDKTGLLTDITLGSSPQPALTHIPKVGNEKSIGWVEQPWIKLGSSVTIFQESKVGMSGVIASVIIVAIVYVFSSNIIMMYARKKEFAVLLSIGWRPNQLSKLLFIEATLIGLFVSIISWLILGLIYVMHDIQTSAIRLFLIGIMGITIYVAGAIIPGLLVRKVPPFETMKAGEVSTHKRHLFKTKTILSMSFKNLLTKWKRSILSVISIALPTSLLIFFLFVTFHLRGTMFTTWLGEYVALEVGMMHYVAMGVAIAIAILTTTEIIWQNVAERQPELAVLKAVGWQNRTIRLLVLIEGAISGLIAGLLGIIFAFGMVWGIYHQFPIERIPFFLLTIFIPITTGIVGATLPAKKAVKIQPYEGLTGGVVNSKKTEKNFRYVFSTMGICLFIGIIALLAQAIPDVQESTNNKQSKASDVKGTSGEVKEVFSSDHSQSEIDTTIEKSKKESLQSIVKSATKVFHLGKTYQDGDRRFTFTLLEEAPTDIEKKSEDTKFITISSELVRDKIPLATVIDYQPHITYRLVDDKGFEYEPVDYQVLESENWKGRIRLGSPGKVKLSLTYEVPKDTNNLILKGFHRFWAKSGILVVKMTGKVEQD
ncbi:FtsX-like permease family protein [Agaribacter marinus]|uniref:ABC transporter permease n=1 Tax=Virgibacillus salarius TaxID=447199 RepID=A0A941DUQ6_9BACI|nr:ABC transporter permease [Virgibacillus salarius]MBR7796086.1 ABC transporter permease [Virgibacillus salarius]NAZ08797.1 FtsX-like permease family protein [Agaribacter marinus]